MEDTGAEQAAVLWEAAELMAEVEAVSAAFAVEEVEEVEQEVRPVAVVEEVEQEVRTVAVVEVPRQWAQQSSTLTVHTAVYTAMCTAQCARETLLLRWMRRQLR